MQKWAPLNCHSFRVSYVAMSPDGSTIVTGAGDETLKFWEVFPTERTRRNGGRRYSTWIVLRSDDMYFVSFKNKTQRQRVKAWQTHIFHQRVSLSPSMIVITVFSTFLFCLHFRYHQLALPCITCPNSNP